MGLYIGVKWGVSQMEKRMEHEMKTGVSGGFGT